MKFAIRKREEVIKPDGIKIINSQIDHYDQNSVGRYSLSWCLCYPDGKEISSEWTPDTNPSITNTILNNPDYLKLIIFGRDNWQGCITTFIQISKEFVKSFGYVGESCGNSNKVIGIFVDTNDGKLIESYSNGFIKEKSNGSNDE